jgi:cell division protease FtsH
MKIITSIFLCATLLPFPTISKMSSRNILFIPNGNTLISEGQNSYLNTLEKESIRRIRHRRSRNGRRIDREHTITSRERNITSIREPTPRPFLIPILSLIPNNKNSDENEQREDDEFGQDYHPRRPTKRVVTESSEGNFRLEKVDNFNFTCVGGYNEVKEELVQVVDFLLHPKNYTVYGVRIPKGVLLAGPPGNGKTLLAKCLAGESNTSFVAAVGSQFQEKYVGTGAARVRELFELAGNNQPCIIFIDELDALGRKRSGGDQGAEAERDQTLNQLLTQLDGFNTDDSVVVLGATNRVDILDPALIRAGRFDKIINVPNPDSKTRLEIIDIHVKNKPINVSSTLLNQMTGGFSGAQIETLLNEATLHALRKQTIPVSVEDIEAAKDKLLLGRISQGRNMSVNAIKRIAIHEIGHLLMSLSSIYHEKPIKVSIESAGQSLGYTMFEENEIDEGIYLREYLEDKIKVLLGGRAAEEVMYGSSVSSGALSDLEKAFGMAKQMITNYGMGAKIIYPYFSDEYKKEVDDEIHKIIVFAYKDVKNMLEKKKRVLIKLADELVEKKTLKYDDIVSIILLDGR